MRVKEDGKMMELNERTWREGKKVCHCFRKKYGWF
jgi:hypothetical protein